MIEVKFCKQNKGYYISEGFKSIKDKDIWLFYELVHDFNRPGSLNEYLQEDGCYGDCSYVEFEGKKARVGWQPLQGTKVFYELEIDRAYLLELVNKWYDLSKRDAKEIIVRRDGERFEIEGVFE